MTGPGALVSACAAALVLSSAAVAISNARGTPFSREAAREALLKGYPALVDVSPDGKLLLLKSAGQENFSVFVQERATGKEVARNTQRDVQLAAVLRPDGRALAFLSDRRGEGRYLPSVLSLESGRTHRLDIFPTTTVSELRWSPDGTHLAYVATRRGSPERWLVVALVDSAAPRLVVPARDLLFRGGIAWSPDGERLAVVRTADPGAVWIVGMSGEPRPLPVEAGGTVRELAWAPHGRSLLATVRGPRDEYFRVTEVDPATGAVREIARGKGDVFGIRYLPDGFGIAYHLNVESEAVSYVCQRPTRGCRRIAVGVGSTVTMAFTPEGDTAIVAHQGRTRPAAAFAVDLRGQGVARILDASTGPQDSMPAAERVNIRSTDGLTIPAYLWRADRRPGRPPAAVLRVHGGPAVQADRVWNRTSRYLVRAGYDVLELNYRGSTGYGASFERAPGEECARVNDVLSAWRHLQDSLGVPPQRSVLYGHSYGALLALKAGVRLPVDAGAIVLVSLGGEWEFPPCGPAAPGDRQSRILVFHGSQDGGLSPAGVREAVAHHFGRDVFRRRGTHWRVFPEEAHTFVRNGTWAEVYAAIAGAVEDR